MAFYMPFIGLYSTMGSKKKPQDGVKPPSQHYKCSVIVVILQGHVDAALRLLPSVFWVAQLVERQTVINSGLLSEGPWFEPMSRSFLLLLSMLSDDGLRSIERSSCSI